MYHCHHQLFSSLYECTQSNKYSTHCASSIVLFICWVVCVCVVRTFTVQYIPTITRTDQTEKIFLLWNSWHTRSRENRPANCIYPQDKSCQLFLVSLHCPLEWFSIGCSFDYNWFKKKSKHTRGWEWTLLTVDKSKRCTFLISCVFWLFSWTLAVISVFNFCCFCFGSCSVFPECVPLCQT